MTLSRGSQRHAQKKRRSLYYKMGMAKIESADSDT